MENFTREIELYVKPSRGKRPYATPVETSSGNHSLSENTAKYQKLSFVITGGHLYEVLSTRKCVLKQEIPIESSFSSKP